MSEAFNGEHLCEEHQGNHSHYARHNCKICRLTAQLAQTQALLDDAERSLVRQRAQRLQAPEDIRTKIVEALERGAGIEYIKTMKLD